MSKAVLISIRPKWVEKIANGEKTIEVRKTRPKLQTPFKCYIYCTMDHPYISVSCVELNKLNYRTNTVGRCNGKVIGEFICDRIYKIDKDSTDFLFKAGGLSVYKQAAEEKCGLCVAMTDDELHGYLGHCQGYGWHISDLLIYDQPRELSEFQRATDPCVFCMERIARECTDCKKWGGDIKRPPQSWCYVEAMKDD
jgi:predicted transcriptional regulator